ncbi:hypothetical protein NDU88_000402 [Pleurodeles waltl]|uniref:Uncharacterized protein n=1 Tax=Pleurodeles waltl TaxID=8319 RepID=A0AAV7S9H9_PLEWA|nr:hypothetical protein NDU88_000402 [Pleurodeles waltl]
MERDASKPSSSSVPLPNYNASGSALDVIVFKNPLPDERASPPCKRKKAGPRQASPLNLTGKKYLTLANLVKQKGTQGDKKQPRQTGCSEEVSGVQEYGGAQGLDAALVEALAPLLEALKRTDNSLKETLKHVNLKTNVTPGWDEERSSPGELNSFTALVSGAPVVDKAAVDMAGPLTISATEDALTNTLAIRHRGQLEGSEDRATSMKSAVAELACRVEISKLQVLQLPPGCAPYVVVLKNVPSLESVQSEQEYHLKNKVTHWLGKSLSGI